jgi:FAD/FMN-containing dehydrogenase
VAAALADLLARLRTASVAPVALEIVSAALASRLSLGTDALLLARLTGNAEAVASQRDALAQLSDVREIASDVWNALRSAEPANASVLRLSSPVARFAETWSAADRLATANGGFAHASVLRSVARVAVPNTDGAIASTAVDALRAGTRDIRIFERLPASLWPMLSPGGASDALSRGVRAAFDPHRLLNPGILGDSE